MSKLQKKPAAHKRGHPTFQNMNFFYFCGSFLPSWIRIRIPNTDPDPLARLNTDPIRIRIRNPASKRLGPDSLNQDSDIHRSACPGPSTGSSVGLFSGLGHIVHESWVCTRYPCPCLSRYDTVTVPTCYYLSRYCFMYMLGCKISVQVDIWFCLCEQSCILLKCIECIRHRCVIFFLQSHKGMK